LEIPCLWMTVMATETATCDVDDDGNCLDRACDNKYPDCEKWAAEGTFSVQIYDLLQIYIYIYMHIFLTTNNNNNNCTRCVCVCVLLSLFLSLSLFLLVSIVIMLNFSFSHSSFHFQVIVKLVAVFGSWSIFVRRPVKFAIFPEVCRT
jgi:hypothetical protein